MNPMYRNQTNNMNVIQAMAAMRITTPTEAVAFLRAEQSIHAQIAGVLQRVSIREQQKINRAAQPAPAPVQEAPAPVLEPAKPFEPEDLSPDEGFSEEEVEKRVAQLKSAKKVEGKEDKEDKK